MNEIIKHRNTGEKMNKHLIVVGIVSVLLICVGLSGCVDENGSIPPSDEDQDKGKFTTLPDGTKVYGDFDKLEILNHSVVTEQRHGIYYYIDVTYEKIADGFVYSENASRYRANVTVKNIAGEILDSITIYVRYYDNLDNFLRSDYDYGYDLYMDDTIDFSFTWGNYSSPSYFKQVDHISFEISRFIER